MATTTITASSTEATEAGEIIHDKVALENKHEIMEKLKWNALLGSISETCKFAAGPVFGLGLAFAVGANPAAGMAVAVPLLLGAAALLTIAVVAGYASTRIWQSGQFDNFELNAESTARHLVQELKTSHVSVTQEHGQNTRADGRKWVQVVNRGDQGGLAPQAT
jgi:hypothetical protein